MDEGMSAELAAELAAPNTRKLIDPRTVPVRFSQLRAFARSPLHFLHAVQGYDSDSLARKLGRGAHALVLGQPVVEWAEKSATGRARPRNGKDYDAFVAANPGAEILSSKEYAQATGMAEAIRRHDRASEIIYTEGTLLEHALTWTHPLGRLCSSHIDVYRPDVLVADLKCVRDASLDRFGRVAIWSHYHAQLAFYVAASEAVGHPVTDAYIVAVENVAPYPVTVRPLTARALDAGRVQCEVWMQQLLVCEQSGEWPGYAQSDVALDLADDGMDAFLPPGDADDEIAF
jgi:hypothetical protein